MSVKGCEFELFQTTKVRIKRILVDGVEVKTKLNTNGFIPFLNLLDNKFTLRLNQALYVRFIGQDKNYHYFVDDNLLDPLPSPKHLHY
ncbi:hypothetical protein UACE39S_05783 [Ureibacillus acetophenoni]